MELDVVNDLSQAAASLLPDAQSIANVLLRLNMEAAPLSPRRSRN